MSQSTSVVLAERPTTAIVPDRTFRTEKGPAPTAADLQDGQLLLETLYVSLDPAMRGWLNDARSYLPPVQIGEVMRSIAVARVLATKSSKADVGDVVVAYTGWTEVCILPEARIENPLKQMPAAVRSQVKVTDLLGVLGMTGLTAFFGITKIADIHKGDTVVISGAAGATGSVAGQLARILGAGKVIGIAGSSDKCKWLVDELGFDVALNYKDSDFAAQLKAATPTYIDVYWDNVGGDILDAALARAKPHARFVMCGGISQYNAGGAAVQGPRNYLNIIAMRIRMQGFIVMDYASETPQAVQQLVQYLAQGKLKGKETIVKGGLAVAEEALVDLFQGKNTGKLLVEVKNPEEGSKL